MTARKAKAKANVEVVPRPLLELLGLNPPEDWHEKREFEYEIHRAWEQYKREHPLGLKQSELNFDFNVEGDVYEILARKLHATGKFIAYLDARYGEEDSRSRAWRDSDAPDFTVLADILQKEFHDFRLHWLLRHLTPGEVAKGLHFRNHSGALDDDIYQHPHFIYAHKLALSAWHWMSRDPLQKGSKIGWNRVAQFHKFFMSFDFAPGFDVTIDHAHHWCNSRGAGEYTGRIVDPVTGKATEGTWLDGEFAFIISQNGVHLLTLGVCTTGAGIIVNQVQLKRKKGNRWLFKLPGPHFEYAMSKLLEAAQAADLPLYLCTGESHAAELGVVHKEAIKADPELAPRITRLYNQRFKSLVRGRKKLTVSPLVYRQILPRTA